MLDIRFDPAKSTILFGDASSIDPEASDYWLWSDLLAWEDATTKSHHWESVDRYPKGDPQGRGGQFAPGGSSAVSTEDTEASGSVGDGRWWNSIPWVRQIALHIGDRLPTGKTEIPDYIDFEFSNKEARRRFNEFFPNLELADVASLVTGIDKEGLSATGIVAPWKNDRLSFEWIFWNGEGHSRYVVGQMAFWTGKNGIGETVAELTAGGIKNEHMKQGVGEAVMSRLIPLLKNMGVRHVQMRADVTIGRYAWAKLGFEYAEPHTAVKVANRFPQWAATKDISQPAEGWPKFDKPASWTTYSIPGVTLTGNDIDNRDIAGSDVMHVGKAYMLDKAGHGDWQANLDLNQLDDYQLIFKAHRFPFKAVNRSKLPEPVRTYIFGKAGENIPEDASDLYFWQDLMNDDESSPLNSMKVERDISHVLRDEHGRWTNTPNAGDDAPEETPIDPFEDAHPDDFEGIGEPFIDVLDGMGGEDDWEYIRSEMGGRKNIQIVWAGADQPDNNKLGRPLTLEDFDLSKEKIRELAKGWIDGDKDLHLEVGLDFGWLEISGTVYDQDGAFELADFNYAVGDSDISKGYDSNVQRMVRLASATIAQREQGKDLGKKVMSSLLQTLADAGVEEAQLEADITIGRYAWAKMGFDYVEPEHIKEVRSSFKDWLQAKNIYTNFEQADRAEARIDRLNTAWDVSSYTLPDGRMFVGADIENDDVYSRHRMSAGKAFMLDHHEYGHGDWNGKQNITFLRSTKSYKAARDDSEAPESRMVYIVGTRGKSIPKDASDAEFWHDVLMDKNSDETSSQKAERDISHVLRDERGRWTNTPSAGDDAPEEPKTRARAEFERREAGVEQGQMFPDESGLYPTDREVEFARHQVPAQEEWARMPVNMAYSINDSERNNLKVSWFYRDISNSRGEKHPIEDRFVTLDDFGFSEKSLVDMVEAWELPDDLNSHMVISISGDELMMRVNSVDLDDNTMVKWNIGLLNEDIGRTEKEREGYGTGMEAHLEYFSLGRRLQNEGLGKRIIDRVFDDLYNLGTYAVQLEADITIGRYAWAKMGFDYEYQTAAVASQNLDKWLDDKGIYDQIRESRFDEESAEESLSEIEYALSRLETAQDVANFRLPDGTTIPGKKISNSDVPKDLQMDAGKAFMLDQGFGGHGNWLAWLNLDDWSWSKSANPFRVYLGWPSREGQSWLLHIENRSVDHMTVKQAELPVVREGETLEDWLQRSVPAIVQQAGMSELEAADVATEAWGIVNPDSAAQESLDTGALPSESDAVLDEETDWMDEDSWGEEYGEEDDLAASAGDNVNDFSDDMEMAEEEDFFAERPATPEPGIEEEEAFAKPEAAQDDDFWDRFFTSGEEEAPPEEEIPPEKAEAEPMAEEDSDEEVPPEENLEDEEEEVPASAAAEFEDDMGTEEDKEKGSKPDPYMDYLDESEYEHNEDEEEPDATDDESGDEGLEEEPDMEDDKSDLEDDEEDEELEPASKPTPKAKRKRKPRKKRKRRIVEEEEEYA